MKNLVTFKKSDKPLTCDDTFTKIIFAKPKPPLTCGNTLL